MEIGTPRVSRARFAHIFRGARFAALHRSWVPSGVGRSSSQWAAQHGSERARPTRSSARPGRSARRECSLASSARRARPLPRRGPRPALCVLRAPLHPQARQAVTCVMARRSQRCRAPRSASPVSPARSRTTRGRSIARSARRASSSRNLAQTTATCPAPPALLRHQGLQPARRVRPAPSPRRRARRRATFAQRERWRDNRARWRV